ncbi:40S ribosomal protein S30, partial [Penicillium alfredii]
VALPILQPSRVETRLASPSTTSISRIPSIANVNHPTWVRFTALSPVRVRSSRPLLRQVLPVEPLYRHQVVEPQEKKKTPKGRAYKRVQYTRRFVNVTMTGGKRKMNPNPGS